MLGLLSGLLLAVVGGCADAPPLPPIVWEGEHLRFGTDADETVLCAGTLLYLDGVAGYLGETFGRPEAGVDYYWLPEGTDGYCPDDAEGCANDRGTFSRYPIHRHELVHAVRWPSRMQLPFEEGLAEAYGDDWNRFPVEGDIGDLLRDPAGNGYIPGQGYGLAAHFVSYLQADHGFDALLELDAATDYEQSYSDAAAAFERVYDQPLEAVIEQYEAEYPRCSTLTFRDKGFDCNRNVIEAPTEIDQEVRTTISLSCDDPAVLGPRGGQRWTTRALEVTVAGRYYVTGRPLDEQQPIEFVAIRKCDASCIDAWDSLSSLTGSQFGSGHCLEPARYLFRFAVAEDLDNDSELAVARVDYPPCE